MSPVTLDGWLTAATRYPITGRPGQSVDAGGNKLGLHTIEASRFTPAVDIAAQIAARPANKRWPYRGISNLARREHVQHNSLVNLNDYSLCSLPGFNSPNRMGLNVQWAIVDYATHMDEVDPEDWEWFLETLVAPVLDFCDIPNNWARFSELGDMWPGEHDFPARPLGQSPYRFAEGAFQGFAGVYPHAAAPTPRPPDPRAYECSHWDPGGINAAESEAYVASLNQSVGVPDAVRLAQLRRKRRRLRRKEDRLRKQIKDVTREIRHLRDGARDGADE